VLCNMFSLINLLIQSGVMALIHVVFRQSQGWCHSLIYAFGIIKQEIVNKWNSYKKDQDKQATFLLYAVNNPSSL